MRLMATLRGRTLGSVLRVSIPAFRTLWTAPERYGARPPSSQTRRPRCCSSGDVADLLLRAPSPRDGLSSSPRLFCRASETMSPTRRPHLGSSVSLRWFVFRAIRRACPRSSPDQGRSSRVSAICAPCVCEQSTLLSVRCRGARARVASPAKSEPCLDVSILHDIRFEAFAPPARGSAADRGSVPDTTRPSGVRDAVTLPGPFAHPPRHVSAGAAARPPCCRPRQASPSILIASPRKHSGSRVPPLDQPPFSASLAAQRDSPLPCPGISEKSTHASARPRPMR